MSFWGIEVKPGKPVTHSFDKVRRRLRISQATLGIGTATNKSSVQCNIGKKSPVFICALLPEKTESCHLDLEFEEADDVVFSVLGPRSVYLTGYYVSNDRHSALRSDTESYGEDIANTETGESSHHSDEDKYDDSFINDDDDPVVFPTSPVSSDGVNEEMLDKKTKIERKASKKRQRKIFQISDSEEETTSQKSEDEDNYPLSVLTSKKAVEHQEASEVEEKTGNITVETNDKTAVEHQEASEVEEKTGNITVETNDKTADCGSSVPPSKEKADAATMHKKSKRKNLPCDALYPSHEASPEKETQEKASTNLFKEEGTFEDNINYHSDPPVDDQAQKNITKVNKCGNLLATKGEDKSELDPLNSTKSRRKRKEYSDDESTLEGSNGNHEKVLEQDKVLQSEAEGDIKHQDLLQPNEPNQRITTNMNVDGESHCSLLHPAGTVDGPILKKRRMKICIEETYTGSNDATYSEILMNAESNETVLEADKQASNLPASSAEDKKPNIDKDTNLDVVADGCQFEKPKRKKKKDKTNANMENANVSVSLQSANESEKPSGSSQVRTLPNGLIIEELALGDQDGKIAALGRKVKIYYTAMLKESGHVFGSNIGQAPYKFRLGDEEIIEGWNVGLEGMRVGDKRRLTIPPSMGYGKRGAGEDVPPNSWLVYDVELARVR